MLKDFDSTLGFPGEGPGEHATGGGLEPLRVEDAADSQIYTDFERAALSIRGSGASSCYVMGTKGKVTERLCREGLAFRALEFVRTDHGVWAHAQNAASLPLGCLSSKAYLRRLRQITILKPIDAGRPWCWKGRIVTNCVLVCLEVSGEIVNGGFSVRCINVDRPDGDKDGASCEDLGELGWHHDDASRLEIVMETTADDARRVRRLEGVKHISQRKVGDRGQVRITVDLPSALLNDATSHCRVWAKSSIRAASGILLYQSKEQWDEMAALLSGQRWAAGRIICESPRWVLVDTTEGVNSDDVLKYLTEWRVAGQLTRDVAYRVWSSDAESKMSISTGTIDTGARAEIRHVDPRFTVGACYALLRAINIHVDLEAISISEASDANGNVSRSVKVSVSRKDVNRLVGIPRRFTWQGEVMRIMFSKSHDALDSKGEGAERANATLVSPCGSPSPRKPSKRGHTPGATPNRVTKSKHDMESDVGETGETILEDEAKDVLPEGRVDLGVPETLLPDLSVGDIVRAPRVMDDGACGAEETLQLVAPRDAGWLVSRMEFSFASIRSERRGDNEGWIVRQPLRQTGYKKAKWFGRKRHGEFAESEARKCKDEWDVRDSVASLMGDSYNERETSDSLRYSLNTARECEESEKLVLSSDSIQHGAGKAEWVRRCAASKFKKKTASSVDSQTGSESEDDGAMDGASQHQQ